MPPPVHPAGPGPVPPATILSDRAGGETVSQDQNLEPVDPLILAIRTLDAAGGAVELEKQSTPRSSRREEILDGAAAMFAEHGYHGASLRDISRRVGISHPGMLHHFSSKDALLGAVIDRLEALAQSVLEKASVISRDRATFESSLRQQWNPSSHPIQLLSTLSGEAVSKDHPARFRMARLRRVHEHVFEQVYTSFQERGELRPGIDPDFAARCTVSMVLSLAVREETVRTLQKDPRQNTGASDLQILAETLLAEPAQSSEGEPREGTRIAEPTTMAPEQRTSV